VALERRALAAACRRRGWRPLAPVEQAGLSAEQLTPAGLEETLRLLEAAAAEALLVAKRGRLCHLYRHGEPLTAEEHKHLRSAETFKAKRDPRGRPSSFAR
jgi:hypothetical protein